MIPACLCRISFLECVHFATGFTFDKAFGQISLEAAQATSVVALVISVFAGGITLADVYDVHIAIRTFRCRVAEEGCSLNGCPSENQIETLVALNADKFLFNIEVFVWDGAASVSNARKSLTGL